MAEVSVTLPDGEVWTRYLASDGGYFFYNQKSGNSQWNPPDGWEDPPGVPPSKPPEKADPEELKKLAALYCKPDLTVQGCRQLRHPVEGHRVRGVALSANGILSVAGTTNLLLDVWTGRSHGEVAEADARQTAISPDGQHVVFGSSQTLRNGSGVQMYTIPAGQRVAQSLVGHEAEVVVVAFAPDGSTVVTGSWDMTARLWEFRSGKQLHVLKGHTNRVEAVAISTAGTVATGSLDKTVRLWSLASGECLHELKGHLGPVMSVGFSPDGKKLVSGSADNSCRVWDVSTGEQLSVHVGHSKGVNAVLFATDDFVISGGQDGSIRYWSLADKRSVQVRGAFFGIGSLALNPQATILAGASKDPTCDEGMEGVVRCWDARLPMQLLSQYDALAQQRAQPAKVEWGLYLSFVPEEAAGVCFNLLHDHKNTDEQYGGRVQRAAAGDVAGVLEKLSSSAMLLVYGTRHYLQNNACLLELALARLLRKHIIVVVEAEGPHALSFGEMLAFDADLANDEVLFTNTAYAVGLVKKVASRIKYAWKHRDEPLPETDSSRETEMALTLFFEGPVDGKALATSADGSTVAWGDNDGTIRLWALPSRQLKQELKADSLVTCLAFSADGKLLASGHADYTVCIWDVVTGKRLSVTTCHRLMVHGLQFNPVDTDQLLSCSDDCTVKVWRLSQSGQLSQQHSFTNEKAVKAISVSPDGKYVASADLGGMVVVRDLVKHTVSRTFNSNMYEKQNRLVGVSISPNGKYIACGGALRTVVWLMEKGEQVYRSGESVDVSWSEDSSSIALCHRNGTISLLDVDDKETTILYGHEVLCWKSSFAKGQQALLSCAADHTVRFWDLRSKAWPASSLMLAQPRTKTLLENLKKNPPPVTKFAFLSHVQKEAGDACHLLYVRMMHEHRLPVWYDKEAEFLDVEAMIRGVAASGCLLVFGTKAYFDRPYCMVEFRAAKELGKPILWVREADPRFGALSMQRLVADGGADPAKVVDTNRNYLSEFVQLLVNRVKEVVQLDQHPELQLLPAASAVALPPGQDGRADQLQQQVAAAASARLQEAEVSLQAALAQIAELKLQTESLSKENGQLKQQVQSLQTEVQSVQKENAELGVENARLKEQTKRSGGMCK
eukprot:g67637.t1